MGHLDGKVALVTGGGRGIGKSIALLLAEAGARVVVTARTKTDIDHVAEEITTAGGEAFAVTLDVSQPDAVTSAFDEARRHFGHIEVLVNNAGIAKSSLIWTTSDDRWDETIAINLSGTFYCMREALKTMVSHKWGRIINIASIAGKAGAPYISSYSASKHGVIGLTRCAALEVAKHGITVNAVCPGYVDTPMTDSAISNIVSKTGVDEEQAWEVLANMSPQNRVMTPEEVAFLTVMLTREEARGINGQAINLDGGGVTA